MDRFLTLTLNGVSSGAIYAALALSLVIIYRATRVVNFAQPGLALIAGFIAYTVTQATGSYWIGFGVALAGGLVMGAVVERTLIRPVQNRPGLSAIIVTLGLLMVLQAVAGMIWSNEPHAFPYAFDFRGRFSPSDLFAVVSVAVTALLLVLFKATPVGLRMRAAAFQPEVARLVGVRVGLMLTLGWALASVVGSLAGMLAVPPFIFPNVLDGVFVYGFTAAVIGGLDSPFGTIVGGLGLGVGLSYVSGFVGPELTTLAALAILVIVLTFRPSGLFGRTTLRQV